MMSCPCCKNENGIPNGYFYKKSKIESASVSDEVVKLWMKEDPKFREWIEAVFA